MRLSDASVVIRPRTAWEAIDLGVLMAQEHRLLLMGSWALVTLPVFALLTALLWNYPSMAMFLFWWLKPAFDRLPLYILSTALFGEAPSLKQALRQWPKLLNNQLLASLTWRRLSLSRSFVMPVSQLEGMDGAGASATPGCTAAAQRRRRSLVNRCRGAPGNRPMVWLHGAVLSTDPATT